MVDAEWVSAGGAVTLTFLKDSVPGDQIGVIMKDTLHTWNKSTQILAIGYDGGEDEGSESPWGDMWWRRIQVEQWDIAQMGARRNSTVNNCGMLPLICIHSLII